MMVELIIDVSGCKTALQFLDEVGKVLGVRVSHFSMLSEYLLQHYFPKITFLGMKEFSARCPHATKEIEMIFDRVRWHYDLLGKKFEYNLDYSSK